MITFNFRNHHLYFDNFFASVDLLLDLHRKGIYSCGTMRKDRRGFPNDLKPHVKKGLKERGDSVTKQHKNLTVTVWQDTKPVVAISTNSDPTKPTTVLRKGKDGSRSSICCPQSISLYNKYMGGVDHNDQLRQYYGVRLKGRKFYKYFFWFVFDVAVTNAFIVSRNHTSQNIPNLKKFRGDLAKDLIGSFNGRKRRGRPTSVSLSKVSCFDHFPMKGDKRLRCHHCYHNKKERHDTIWYCQSCKLPFCHTGASDDCFLIYHKSL